MSALARVSGHPFLAYLIAVAQQEAERLTKK